MGEDPYLNGQLGIAMIHGLQGRGRERLDHQHVAVTLKHVAGHGQPEGGVNRAPAHMGPRELLETHLVPFAMAIKETSPDAVMPSYNEIDGVPAHVNRWLLEDVLRKRFHFAGLVTSDYGGIHDLAAFHRVTANDAEAALRAIRAGVDMDFAEGASFKHLVELVQANRIEESELNASVARVLRLKFQLGLFEDPYGDAAKARSLVEADSSVTLAREAAAKSIVLLKNQGGILPLDPLMKRTIAVIGPHSDGKRSHPEQQRRR